MSYEFNPLCLDLAGLNRHQRRLYRLHFQYGLPVAAIAESMEMTRPDVQVALVHARAAYRKCYDRLGFGITKKIVSPRRGFRVSLV